MKQIPMIYESTAVAIDGYALGSLPDALSCVVTEERNGEFYCEMSYSIYGLNADLLKLGRIIAVNPNLNDNTQGFRINKIEKALDGTMDIIAYHVSYDLTNTAITPFAQAAGIQAALTNLTNAAATANTFTLGTDIVNTASMYGQPLPNNMRGAMLGQAGSLLDVFGGEWKFDNWNCTLLKNRGQDRNVQIAYGKNLSSFKETDQIGDYDTIMPYAVVDDVLYILTDTTVCPTAPLVEARALYGYPKTITVDLSDNFDSAPTNAQLYSAAQQYIGRHSTEATANMATEYLDLQKLIGSSERVDLCDTVNINVHPYNVNIQSKVITTVYDVLLDEYSSVQIGDKKVTLADELAPVL